MRLRKARADDAAGEETGLLRRGLLNGEVSIIVDIYYTSACMSNDDGRFNVLSIYNHVTAGLVKIGACLLASVRFYSVLRTIKPILM